jgi:DNA-binding transcriptional LysR family regulator
VSRLAARGAILLGRVVQLQVSDLDLRRRFYIVSHREKYLTPGIRAFLEICDNAAVLLEES